MYSEYELIKELKSLIPSNMLWVKQTESYSKYMKAKLIPNNIYVFIELNRTSRRSIIDKYETFAFLHVAINNEELGDLSLIKVGVDFIDMIERIKTINIDGIFVNSSSQPYFDKDKECWVRAYAIRIRWNSNLIRIINKFNDPIIQDLRLTDEAFRDKQLVNDINYKVEVL